jgi:hypothetical protein
MKVTDSDGRLARMQPACGFDRMPVQDGNGLWNKIKIDGFHSISLQ